MNDFPDYANVTDNIVGYDGDPENPDPIYESDLARAWPTHCAECGTPIFTGNTSGRCADCNETPRFPWNLDRHLYPALPCPNCGTPCTTSHWCGQCGKTVTP